MSSIQDQFRALQSQFRDEIEGYLIAANMTPTEFGKHAANDPKFVFQVRAGRSCGADVIDRVRGFMRATREDESAKQGAMVDSEQAHILDRLSAVIESRRGADPDSSYTARLLAKGPKTIAQKVGEEAIETVIARLAEDKSALAAESADLLYHLLVLWAEAGLDPEEVWAALEARTGTGGIEEKRRRPDSE